MTTVAKSTHSVALEALVRNGGQIPTTVKALDKAGLKVDARTLKQWRDETHNAEYLEIERRVAQEIESEVISLARSNAHAAAAAEAKAIAKASEQLDRPHISAKDAASAANDLAKVKSANIDKMLVLTGRPSVISESRDMIAILQSLEKDGVLKVIDAEATEE